jgi:hypothetical protein
VERKWKGMDRVRTHIGTSKKAKINGTFCREIVGKHKTVVGHVA